MRTNIIIIFLLLTISNLNAYYPKPELDRQYDQRVSPNNIGMVNITNIKKNYNDNFIETTVIVNSSQVIKQKFGKEYQRGDLMTISQYSKLLKDKVNRANCMGYIKELRMGWYIKNKIQDISNNINTSIITKLKDCNNIK